MGLDMYLQAKKYVSGYEHGSEKARNEYAKLVRMAGAEKLVDTDHPSAYIEVVAAYWRKANHIHQWFVDNVQEGNDDCGTYYVEDEKLRELRNICAGLLIERDMIEAREKLPPQSGFFFGGTNIDEYYWSDVEETVKQIDRVLEHGNGFDIYYHSSW